MRKITDHRNLPYAAAAVQAVIFAIAGQKALPYVGWLAGLGVGAVVNYSLAFAASRFSDIAEKRKPLATVALVLIFALSPATITLSLFLPSSVFTAIAWAVCVDTAIVLAGAIAGKSLIPQEKQVKPARKQVKPAPEPEKPAFVCSCGATFGSQPALNAHQRKHKKIVGYVASFEPVTEEKVTKA